MTCRNERDVLNKWLLATSVGKRLKTTDGRKVEIIFPGRPNDDAGADIRDAVADINGRLHKGDIEIHFRTADWKYHGHHRDTNYNRVILHVVWNHRAGTTTISESGRSIPLIDLSNMLDEKTPTRPTAFQCKLQNHENAPELMAALGRRRFLIKSLLFRQSLLSNTPAQCLYTGIMEALGYSRNKLPFKKLAGGIPVETHGSLLRQGENHFTAVMLGTAGLLPSQSGKPCLHGYKPEITASLEYIWRNNKYSQYLNIKEWNLFRLHPINHPVSRITKMAGFLSHYGGMEKIKSVLREAIDYSGHTSGTNEIFALLNGKEKNPTFFRFAGTDRARQMMINIIYPFFHALGERENDFLLCKNAIRQAETCPASTCNTIERHIIKQTGMNHRNNAIIQQGLLEIYKTYCINGKCEMCISAADDLNKSPILVSDRELHPAPDQIYRLPDNGNTRKQRSWPRYRCNTSTEESILVGVIFQ